MGPCFRRDDSNDEMSRPYFPLLVNFLTAMRNSSVCMQSMMASKFVGVSFGKALRAALPIYVVFLVTICFTIYFPKVVLWLPKHVIPESVGCFKSPAGTGYICPQ